MADVAKFVYNFLIKLIFGSEFFGLKNATNLSWTNKHFYKKKKHFWAENKTRLKNEHFWNGCKFEEK